jgi:hypothetical protein
VDDVEQAALLANIHEFQLILIPKERDGVNDVESWARKAAEPACGVDATASDDAPLI